jgi:hypothetical protein
MGQEPAPAPASRTLSLASAAWLLSVALSSACAPLPRQPAEETLQAAYAKAVADARKAEPTEIDKELVWINPANPQLLWSAGKDRVLVVTWTDWDGYDGAVGREMRLGREVWVTAVPELRRRCNVVPASADLVLRMEQMLGLPPHDGKTRLVQLWADPRDMFRPAPDPEVSDSQADLGFPVSSRAAVSGRHVAWFNDLRAKSYGPDGYPWTRLGYTYDWGDPSSEVGLSEFIVEKDAGVIVEGVYTADSYCLRERS